MIIKKVVYTVFNCFIQMDVSKQAFTSKLAMIQLTSKLSTFSANENESRAVNSLTAKGDQIVTKNFARLYVGVYQQKIKWDKRRKKYQ